jgi:hypothetical protein
MQGDLDIWDLAAPFESLRARLGDPSGQSTSLPEHASSPSRDHFDKLSTPLRDLGGWGHAILGKPGGHFFIVHGGVSPV